MNAKQEFIEKIAKYVIPIYGKYEVLPSLAIAQAVHESAWGVKAKGNNLYGIKWHQGHKKQIFWTQEYNKETKKFEKKALAFCAYDSLRDSIQDYLELLQKPRYARVRQAQTYFQAAKQVKRAGYATGPTYDLSLIKLIKDYKLENYDEQVTEVYITSHFKLVEFDSGDGEIMPEQVRANLRGLATKLEELRSHLGSKPIVVNSGYRSPEWNREVNGAKRSMHLVGLAADVRIPNISPKEVFEAAEGFFNGRGLYHTFCHLDLREKKTAWTG